MVYGLIKCGKTIKLKTNHKKEGKKKEQINLKLVLRQICSNKRRIYRR